MSEIISGGMSGAQAGASIASAIGKGAAFGPAGAIIGGLVGVLGGIGARRKRRKQRRKMLAQINQQKAKVRSQIPGIRAYFDALSKRQEKISERQKGRAIDEFVGATIGTVPVLQRKIASTGLEGSGTAERLVTSTREKLQGSVDVALDDITTQEEEKQLTISRNEKNQLQSLYDQITMLESKAESL